MKKVLAVFLGLVVLAQGVKLWGRGHDAASARRAVPAVTHHPHPGNGGNNAKPKVMLA